MSTPSSVSTSPWNRADHVEDVIDPQAGEPLTVARPSPTTAVDPALERRVILPSP
jgi:hypothetical protein